jgi:hypothetical protein
LLPLSRCAAFVASRSSRINSTENFGSRVGAVPITLSGATPLIAAEEVALPRKLGLADTTVATPTRALTRRSRPPAKPIAALAAAGEAFAS